MKGGNFPDTRTAFHVARSMPYDGDHYPWSHKVRCMSAEKKAIVLVNLGTPDEPTPAAVRRYLKQFLSDPRVVEAPRFIWFWVLRLVILPFRPRRVAALYQSIWGSDSPIRDITREQADELARRLPDITVDWAMTYGYPSLPGVLDRLMEQGHDTVQVLPLYPQYSGSTGGAVVDAVADWARKRRELPTLLLVRDYWQEPRWQQAVADSVRDYQREQGVPDRLLFSFHGIPQAYEDNGDRYGERCRASAAAIAQRLDLNDGDWAITFQSRFGPSAWLQPYTDKTLEQWGRDSVRHVQVVCPGFAADCLETLEEISVENRDIFLTSGGKKFGYIPALNARKDHIDALEAVSRRLVSSSHTSSDE